MNNGCVNLRIRTKKGVKYFFCVRRKAKIEREECFCCLNREFKKTSKMASKTCLRTYAKLTAKTPIKKVNKNNKVTRATSITKNVKLKVWERDNHKCIFCGKEVSWEYANSHYIKRSHLGMGIEENIMTNCDSCHSLFERSLLREEMLKLAKEYLSSKYEDWNEDNLIYRK